MRSLPLYPTYPVTAIEQTQPKPLNPDCYDCELRTDKTRSPCMATEVAKEDQTGGLLVVYPSPTLDEDAVGRPFATHTARAMRDMIAADWTGPVAYTPAVRCAAGARLDPIHVEACRPYLADTVSTLKPERIICFGSHAALAVLGRKLRPFDARRAYSYTEDGVPVFTLFHPVEAANNRFIMRWLKRDLTWALTQDPPKPPTDSEYEMVDTPEDAAAVLEQMRQAKWIVFDVETAGVMFEDEFKIVCCAVALDNMRAFVWSEEALEDAATAAPLIDALRDPSVPVIGQNLKYDVTAFAADPRPWIRTTVRGVYGDTMLWRKVFESDASASLDTLSELVGMGGAKAENAVELKAASERVKKARSLAADGYGFPRGLVEQPLDWAAMYPNHGVGAFAYGLVKRDVLYRYNARDVVVTAALARLYELRISHSPTATRTWHTLLKPATHALSKVQAWGMAATKDGAEAFSAYLAHHLQDLKTKLMGWGEFNPDSAQSTARHLYERLRLPVFRTSAKTGQPSTDKAALASLRTHHQIVPLIEEYRLASKMKGTYADGMMQHIRSDGRIHGRLRLDGTRSGRLSMQEPNLQNIPSRAGRISKMAKDLFVAPPGRVLIQLDYSQLEYRVAAILSGDPVFRQVFIDGHDLHQRTAELIAPVAWGIQPEAVTKDHRRSAKTVNFGLFYGMGDESLASMLGCSNRQARKIREAVLGQFEVTAKWIDSRISYTHEQGVTWTYWDGEKARMRQLWNIASGDGGQASRAKNGSFNTPVQGSAADYCLRSLCEIVQWIEDDNLTAKVVNTVHDSIIIECDEADAHDMVYGCREIMEGWPSDGVPLVVDAEIGWSWGTLIDYQLAQEAMACEDGDLEQLSKDCGVATPLLERIHARLKTSPVD